MPRLKNPLMSYSLTPTIIHISRKLEENHLLSLPEYLHFYCTSLSCENPSSSWCPFLAPEAPALGVLFIGPLPRLSLMNAAGKPWSVTAIPTSSLRLVLLSCILLSIHQRVFSLRIWKPLFRGGLEFGGLAFGTCSWTVFFNFIFNSAGNFMADCSAKIMSSGYS